MQTASLIRALLGKIGNPSWSHQISAD